MRRATPLSARGEPLVWLTGAGLAVATIMILVLLGLVLVNGALTFWPRTLVELTLDDGTKVLGEVTRSERFRTEDGWSTRRLIRVGNYDLYGEDFRWVDERSVVEESRPEGAWLVERLEWGPAIGYPVALTRDGSPTTDESVEVVLRFPELHEESFGRMRAIEELEHDRIAVINHEMESLRLEQRRAVIDHGEGSAEAEQVVASVRSEVEALSARFAAAQEEIEAIRAENARSRFVMQDVSGRIIPERPGTPDTPLQIAQIVRAYPANTLSLAGQIGVYLDRWREYLVAEPREANTEGGVWPAIFGTLMMTIMMSLAVAPFGVIAALYLREYAKQGVLVSVVRIAVNNLAGVPSIVFGVFGLGFFCYVLGGTIDDLFFAEKLPSPTYGTGGILWASLTLALLTVPVVIVSTEEALAAVPRSMREGSFACGASKWQTLRRIVLPLATPGIMTGLILAMARGAGEVAPLMITGVVKLAPELPFDSFFPFFHVERSFMHLGFHIYDVGFQSRNSEAGKPMVFTTTLLLISMITLLNLSAIYLRARLRQRFKTDQF